MGNIRLYYSSYEEKNTSNVSFSRVTYLDAPKDPETSPGSTSNCCAIQQSTQYSKEAFRFYFPSVDMTGKEIKKITLKHRITADAKMSLKLNNSTVIDNIAMVAQSNLNKADSYKSIEISDSYWDGIIAGLTGNNYISVDISGTSGYGSRSAYVWAVVFDIEYQTRGSFKIGAKALKKAIFNGLNIKRILQGTTVLFQVGLPDEYQQVAYIGFDGTNSGSSSTPYIDTGIVPSATKGFYLDANITQGASGSSDGANGKTMIRGWSDNTELYWDGDVDKKQPYVVGRHTWTIDYYNHRVGYDTTYDTISNPTTGYATATFFLGAWHEWGAAYYGMAGRVYGFKVYDNGTLIADYIPCYRKSNGVIGFYDMASGTFLTNSGSGALTKGFDVDPTVYQEVEYIESSGTQWIDTGFAHKQNTRFLADIDFDPQSAWVSAFGSWGGTSGSESKFFGAEYNGTGLSAYYYKSSSLYQFPSSCFLGRKIWDLNGRNWNIGGTSHTFSSGSFTSRYTDIIFGNRSYGGSAAAFSRMKLYSFKIYDNGTLIRDFIPCYRVADNEVGLYDIVNNQFYTNQGTGSFTKGNNI